MQFVDKVELMGLIQDINDSFEMLCNRIQRSSEQASEKARNYEFDTNCDEYKTKKELIEALMTVKAELAKRHQSLLETLEKEFGGPNT